jgi:hypothetical protein
METEMEPPILEIPKVSASLLIRANDAVGASRSDSASVAIVTALGHEYEPGQVQAAILRLMALTRIVRERLADKWTIAVQGEKYALADQALFEAAAQARLAAHKTTPMKDIAFDEREFLELALGAAGPAGSA